MFQKRALFDRYRQLVIRYSTWELGIDIRVYDQATDYISIFIKTQYEKEFVTGFLSVFRRYSIRSIKNKHVNIAYLNAVLDKSICEIPD